MQDVQIYPSTSPATALAAPKITIRRSRYLRVLVFFARMFIHILFWELFLRRILGKKAVERGRSARLRRYAARFRNLAVHMGGVMIKLGQFVSIRVDVMPPEIIEELAGLQDEVPPEPTDRMLAIVEQELGKPHDALFTRFNRNVTAAASLGQVYRARLHSGEAVAVKVLRPGIETLVATDLKALSIVARWAMLWSLIRRRANVPALMDEFARTLWEELDYVSEAANAERFQDLFATDHRVYIPEIFHDYSTSRVLTMEDVTSIKISDNNAIDAAGIDRRVVARRLLDIYLKMIFDFGFFHADPHPGNLFVYPFPGEPAPGEERRFYIIFVDFGMTGHIGENVRAGLREALISAGTRDASRMITAYQKLGVLLPSADLARIEEAEQEVMNYIWGKSVAEVARMPHSEMAEFAIKYRDLMYEMPFQVPQDFIYLGRAIGILSGMCTLLDPSFNPWAPIAEYAEKLVSQEARSLPSTLLSEAARLGQTAVSIPNQLQDVLTRLQRGSLTVNVDIQQDMRRVELSITRLNGTLTAGALLITGAVFFVNGFTIPGAVFMGSAGVVWLLGTLRNGNNHR